MILKNFVKVWWNFLIQVFSQPFLNLSYYTYHGTTIGGVIIMQENLLIGVYWIDLFLDSDSFYNCIPHFCSELLN